MNDKIDDYRQSLLKKRSVNYYKSQQWLINSNLCLFVIALFVLLIFTTQVKGQTYPSGFSQVLVASGITNPTAMAFSPDGRIFICRQTGEVRVVKNGALLATPFMSISVSSSGERGLLGIAFDPDFAINQHIYFYHTLPTAANNRITRFTANGDVVLAGSDSIILNLDPLSSATNHNGGTMLFGNDGKLYVGIGENANTAHAQNLDTYHGKVIRVNKNGSVPPGNPFTTGSAQRLRVWSYGLRNPYTLSVDLVSGRIFVNDVGQFAWEEINEATSGGLNYGWPAAEGMDPNPAYTNPYYTYPHGANVGQGCAITGGTFLTTAATNYPATYRNKYYFIDYCNNWIDYIPLSGTVSRTNFATNIGGLSVGITTGPDGNLYYLSRDDNALYKIVYTQPGTPPLITSNPQSQTIAQGNPVTFTVAATGTPPFSYQWQKNSSNISGATASSYTISSVMASHAGQYRAIVTNAFGSSTSNQANLTVTSPNSVPNATINTPAAGATYAGGNTINFSGSGTDTEDGTLPASAFEWYVLFHHDSHTHPGPTVPQNVTSGSFTIPNSGETSSNVFYRLYLVVEDTQGARDTSFRDILPLTSTITLASNPAGLQLTLDGQPVNTPYTVTSVEGILRTIGVISPQTISSKTYSFNSWQHGGSASQTIATPVSNTTYTANFVTTYTLLPAADAYVRSGINSNTNYGTSTQLIVRKADVAGNDYHEIFLRFNISSLTTSINSAVLRLYGSMAVSGSVKVQAFGVGNNSWQENVITYSNRPTNSSVNPKKSKVVSGATPVYYEFDITQYVINRKNAGANNLSLVLRCSTETASNYVVFNSKEAASNKPQLVVIGTFADDNQFKNAFNDDEIKSEEIVSFFPNPVHDLLFVKMKNEFQNGELVIFDIQGKKVLQREITTKELVTDISGLKKGFYTIIVRNKEATITKKIIVD